MTSACVDVRTLPARTRSVSHFPEHEVTAVVAVLGDVDGTDARNVCMQACHRLWGASQATRVGGSVEMVSYKLGMECGGLSWRGMRGARGVA